MMYYFEKFSPFAVYIVSFCGIDALFVLDGLSKTRPQSPSPLEANVKGFLCKKRHNSVSLK